MDFSLIRHNTRRTGSRNPLRRRCRPVICYDAVALRQGARRRKGRNAALLIKCKKKTRGSPPLQKNWRVRWPSVFHRWSANVCVCAAMLSLVLHFPLFRVYFVLYADERNSRSNDGRWHLEFHPTLFSFFLLYPTRSVIDVAPATAIMFVNRKQ